MKTNEVYQHGKMIVGLLKNWRPHSMPALMPATKNVQNGVNVIMNETSLIPYQNYQNAAFNVQSQSLNSSVSYVQPIKQTDVDVTGPEIIYFWGKLKECFGSIKPEKKGSSKKVKKQSCKKKKSGKQKNTCMKKKDACDQKPPAPVNKDAACKPKDEPKKEDCKQKVETKKVDMNKNKSEPCKKQDEKKDDPCRKRDALNKMKVEEKKADPCKKKEDPCKKKEDKKEDPCKKKEEKKEDPCKKKEDPCKKKEDPCKKKEDPCKKKEDPCKQKEDPCKKKEDPCKKKEEKKVDPCKKKEDPCKKKEEKKEDPCKTKEEKKEDPCKKKEDPCKKKEDPCKKKEEKKEDPCKKKEDPCKKKEDPCKKKEDLCKKKEDPCKKKEEKKEDPCKKKEDPCKKKEDPCKKKEDPCKKKEDPCEKKEDPCKKKEDPCKKSDPCGKFIPVSLPFRDPVVFFARTSGLGKKEDDRCTKPCRDPCAEGSCNILPGQREPCSGSTSWKIKVHPCRKDDPCKPAKCAAVPNGSGGCIVEKLQTAQDQLAPDDSCVTKSPCGKKVCPNKCDVKRKTKFSNALEETDVHYIYSIPEQTSELLKHSNILEFTNPRGAAPSSGVPDPRNSGNSPVKGIRGSEPPAEQKYSEKVAGIMGKIKALWEGPSAAPSGKKPQVVTNKSGAKGKLTGKQLFDGFTYAIQVTPRLKTLSANGDSLVFMADTRDDFEKCEDHVPPCPAELPTMPCPAQVEDCVKTSDELWSDIDANWGYERFPWKSDVIIEERLEEVSLKPNDPYSNNKL